MPNRILREGILDSESVCSLSFQAEVFYRRLMSVVDDFGRFDGRVGVLRSRLYPLQIDKVREADITRWIAECETAGVIALYAVGAKPYILFRKCDPPRANASKFPSPPAGTGSQPPAHVDPCAQPQADADMCAQPRPYSYSVPYSDSESNPSPIADSSEPVRAPASKPANAAEPPPETILTFPTVGSGAKVWHLSAKQVADWQAVYPGIDVLADCRKAHAWVLADTGKAKTARGMPTFLVKWLNRSTNSAGGHSRPGASAASPKPPAETSMERTMRIAAQMQAGQAGKAPGAG